MPAPSWLLLFWSGFAASMASEWIVAAVRALFTTKNPLSRTARPRLMSAPRASVPLALAIGTLVAAPAYGIIFEWWNRADLMAGLALGTLHGAIAGAVAMVTFLRRRRIDRRLAPVRVLAAFRARRMITRVLYGGLLGFLYVVPPR